jgi:PAS domain S-box-containing protein
MPASTGLSRNQQLKGCTARQQVPGKASRTIPSLKTVKPSAKVGAEEKLPVRSGHRSERLPNTCSRFKARLVNHQNRSVQLAAFPAGGNAGQLLRAQDWQHTPLGHPDQWPYALTTLVRVMLNSGQPMFVAWGAQRVLLYNDGYSMILGARHPQAFARPLLDAWPEIRDLLGSLVDRVFAGDPIQEDDLPLTLHRNGYPEEAYFSFSYTPVPDNHGTIIGLFCVCTETTSRVSDERQQVVEAKRERDRLFQMSRDLFGVATFDGYLKSVNPAWSRQLERSTEELLSRPFAEIIHPDDLAATGEVVALLQAGIPVHQFHVRLLKADGTPIAFAWSAVPETEPATGSFYTVGRDISDELRREEGIRQGQKMEAIGQLTGGLAHDFNNLLQAVHGCLDLILRKPEDAERVGRLARNALQASQRGTKLTAQLLAFSRAQKLELRPLQVVSLIDGMVDILHSSVGPLIKLTIEADQLDLSVLSEPTQLEMALFNLVINARDAMPEGGELTIAVREQQITDSVDLPPGRYVDIHVSDTGIGMSPAVAKRAFEPFFTTKGVGQGTGLGLSQVYAMAKQAGGTTRIEHRLPQGTSVILCLPWAEIATTAPAVHASMSAGNYQGKTVLVVDDDSGVRQFLSTALETLGFNVAVAEDAHHGLAVLDDIVPDLMIVDFAMPRMNGAQMAELVQARRPDLPIIFASGYSDTAAIEAAVGSSAVLLRKPFTVSDLGQVIGSTLE